MDRNGRSTQPAQNGEFYPVVTRGRALAAISHRTRSFVNSAFCKRCSSQLEMEIVAIAIAQGMTGEIQNNGAAKLTSAIHARLAKAPNKNATRRAPHLNGNGYRHRACTISANGKATTKSTK